MIALTMISNLFNRSKYRAHLGAGAHAATLTRGGGSKSPGAASGSVLKALPQACYKSENSSKHFNWGESLPENLPTCGLVLANSTDAETLAIENELALDNEGWALLAPFGEHLKERMAVENGQMVRQKFLQIVDEQAVNDLLSNENTVFRRIKRALVGLPVFKGHPDLRQHSPETVSLDTAKPSPLGLVDGLRKTARGMESRFSLTPEGAHAVENDGCKYVSGLWYVKPTGETRNGAMVVRPFKLISVGLTSSPNISGVDSLANAKTIPAAKQTETQTKTENMKSLLIGWLAAQGVALANDATDQTVFEALNKELSSRASNITALSNEKNTLNGNITTLTTERDAQKKRADDAATALANANDLVKAERKGRAEAFIDLMIAQGRLAVAERDANITTLANSNDFAVESGRLSALPVKHKVASTQLGERKEGASTTKSAHEQVISLANSDARYKDIPDFGKAMEKILADHPALAEQLKQKAA